MQNVSVGKLLSFCSISCCAFSSAPFNLPFLSISTNIMKKQRGRKCFVIEFKFSFPDHFFWIDLHTFLSSLSFSRNQCHLNFFVCIFYHMLLLYNHRELPGKNREHFALYRLQLMTLLDFSNSSIRLEWWWWLIKLYVSFLCTCVCVSVKFIQI